MKVLVIEDDKQTKLITELRASSVVGFLVFNNVSDLASNVYMLPRLCIDGKHVKK